MRQWNGYAGPQLPNGTWFGSIAALGDASGGFIDASLLFGAARSLGVSLEGFQVESTEIVTSSTGTIATAGIDSTKQPTSPMNLGAISMNDVTGSFGRHILNNVGFRMGYLGRLESAPRVSCFLTNIGAGETLFFWAYGYTWDAEAMSLGPRRPPDGTYIQRA